MPKPEYASAFHGETAALPAPRPRVLQTETLPAYRFWIFDGQMHAPEAEEPKKCSQMKSSKQSVVQTGKKAASDGEVPAPEFCARRLRTRVAPALHMLMLLMIARDSPWMQRISWS